MKSHTVEYLRFGDASGILRLSDKYIRNVGTRNRSVLRAHAGAAHGLDGAAKLASEDAASREMPPDAAAPTDKRSVR